MTIHATFQGSLIAAGETKAGSRTISGLAVPWDLPGRVSDGTTVVFHPGSLAAGSKPVAFRDHDRTRPIGTVTDSRDTSAGMFATITVSKVPAGDEALILAGDGALPALSVGAEPTEWDYDADGTLHVHAADWLELSLLTLGAFSEARVGTVTAAPPKESPMSMTDTPDTEEEEAIPFEPPDGEPVPDPDEDKPAVETSAQVVPITAARRGTNHPARVHPFAHVGIRELAGVIHAAAVSGDPSTVHRIMTSPGARAPISIQAALTDVTLVGTNNVGAIYRPGYQAELVEIVSYGSPAVDALRQGDLERGDYPNKTFNRWTTLPTMATQSAEKVAITSGPAAVTPTSVPVTTIAGGNDLSQQLLDFGSPSFIEDYVRAAGVVYAQKIDIYAVTALLAAATAVTTVTNDTLVAIIGKLIGGLNWALTPSGPLFCLVSPDLAAGAYGITAANGPAFWDGTISFGSFPMSTTLGGLTVVADPNLPAKTAVLGPRNAATWYDLPGTPFSLRAVNVTNLGLDIAVYGYCALGVQYPGALVEDDGAVMVAWTTTDLVAVDLGPGVGADFLADPAAQSCVDASNDVCWQKRYEAGYADASDPGSPAPSVAVAKGATLYAVALWRERASTDGYASFEGLSSYTPVGGSWGQIKRLLGIGKAQVDIPLDPTATPYGRRTAVWRRYL